MARLLFYLKDGRNCSGSSGAGSPCWPSSALHRWAGSGERPGQGGAGGGCSGPGPPADDHVLARDASGGSSGSEKDAQEVAVPDQDRENMSSESDRSPKCPRQSGDIREEGRSPRFQALDPRACISGGLSKAPDVSSSTVPQVVYLSPREAPAAAPHKPRVSKVPLRLQIKVCGQSSGLGISIAGGKGSLPYREGDEGIFISRVLEGGPSDKAGIHVGDKLLEVNGLDLRGMAHHEAVSALRHAGSCLRMKVLREKMLPIQVCSQDSPFASQTGVRLRQQGFPHEDRGCRMAEADHLPRSIDTALPNGNSDVEMEPNWKLFRREADARTITNPFEGDKNTMTIPRIILTHPSTSDDDVDACARGAEGEPSLAHSDSAAVHSLPGGFKSPHYPP